MAVALGLVVVVARDEAVDRELDRLEGLQPHALVPSGDGDDADSVGLPYAVVGGLAVSAWATPRATQDVDLHAELPDAAHASLGRALRERGFEVPAMEGELSAFTEALRPRLARSRKHSA